MWNLGKFLVFPAGSSPLCQPRCDPRRKSVWQQLIVKESGNQRNAYRRKAIRWSTLEVKGIEPVSRIS